MFRLAFMASFFLVVAGLLAVGLVSWLRTQALRLGSITQSRDPPANASFSSSRATFLAALAGIAAVAWGASMWAGHLSEAVPLVAVGTFIVFTGSVARVTRLRADDDGIVVMLARRRPFRRRWSDLLALRPPAGPLGGWRLTDVRGASSTLMPSDLFGHEELLETIVVRAGLRFDGRIWSQDPGGEAGEGPTASVISLGRR
ncbi:MAG TPA: hypothetical protein VGL18_14775 [Actinomycetota bacterium]|jgi:hypothetical protein